MRNLETRLQTFRDRADIWPAHRIAATPEQMAQAGLYFLGKMLDMNAFKAVDLMLNHFQSHGATSLKILAWGPLVCGYVTSQSCGHCCLGI